VLACNSGTQEAEVGGWWVWGSTWATHWELTSKILKKKETNGCLGVIFNLIKIFKIPYLCSSSEDNDPPPVICHWKRLCTAQQYKQYLGGWGRRVASLMPAWATHWSLISKPATTTTYDLHNDTCLNTEETLGPGWSSVVECTLSMCKALSVIPSPPVHGHLQIWKDV
jgi:hypothetical protein